MWLLHVSVYDHHQGACNWAWLNYIDMKTFSKVMSLTVMRWCGSMSQYGVCAVRSSDIRIVHSPTDAHLLKL